MSLELDFLGVMDALASSKHDSRQLKQQAISVLDLTILDTSASEDMILALQTKANQYSVAAVCVYAQHLHILSQLTSSKRASVVNFPDGDASIDTVLKEITDLVTNHVDEIDYVFPWKLWLTGKETEALAHCKEACTLAHQYGKIFKVILETGAHPSTQSVYRLSRELVAMGCDFLKTSTGKISAGATPLAAFCILKALHSEGAAHCGIKLSGGIKTADQAFLYMDLARAVLQRDINKNWFRIGASSLLDELLI